MTAPLTPPHQPPPQNSWPSPYPEPADEDGPVLRTELKYSAVVAGASTLAGVLLGLLWVWLAPRVPLISDGKAVFLKESEGESAIAADGTFALLALGFGLVAAALVFLFERRGGVALVIGLALGGILGSVVAWRLGVLLGPTEDVVAHARAVGQGVTFDAPIKLQAWGAVLAWPLAAMVVHLGLTALFGPRDPEPEWDDHPAPPPADSPTDA